jgi:hypothetical protein
MRARHPHCAWRGLPSVQRDQVDTPAGPAAAGPGPGTLSVRTFREYYADTGMLPNLTWVPIIILFPLVLPAPTRLMLGAAIAAGAMQPVAVFLLDWWGKVPAGADAYVNMTPGSAIAVGLAYMGARVVYGWGKGCGGA